MKTMLVFNTPLGLENNIPEIKKRVVEYLGSRLIKDNPEIAPMVELNTTIDTVDKEQIASIVNDILDTAAVFVIEAEDDVFEKMGGNICVLQPVSS